MSGNKLPESHEEQTPVEKKQWQEAKLEFIEPKLAKHGELKGLTGFFGGFTPTF
jgi:hypothetical protein